MMVRAPEEVSPIGDFFDSGFTFFFALVLSFSTDESAKIQI